MKIWRDSGRLYKKKRRKTGHSRENKIKNLTPITTLLGYHYQPNIKKNLKGGGSYFQKNYEKK